MQFVHSFPITHVTASIIGGASCNILKGFDILCNRSFGVVVIINLVLYQCVKDGGTSYKLPLK